MSINEHIPGKLIYVTKRIVLTAIKNRYTYIDIKKNECLIYIKNVKTLNNGVTDVVLYYMPRTRELLYCTSNYAKYLEQHSYII